MREVSIIWKPVQWFALKIIGLVFVWQGPSSWKSQGINPFQANVQFLYLLKTSEVFREYGNRTFTWSGLKHLHGFFSDSAGNYMFKVNNRNTGTRRRIWSKLTIKTPERRQWHRSGVFIVSFEYISHFVVVFLLLTLTR